MDSKQDIKQLQAVLPKNTIDKVLAYFYKNKQYNFAKSILTTMFCLRRKSNDSAFLCKMLQTIVYEHTASIFALELGKYCKLNPGSDIVQYGVGKHVKGNRGSIFIDVLEKWDLNDFYNHWNFSVPEQFLNYLFGCKLFDAKEDDCEFKSYGDMLDFMCEEADHFLDSLVEADKLVSSRTTHLSWADGDLGCFGIWDRVDEIEQKLEQQNRSPSMQARIKFLKNERRMLKKIDEQMVDEMEEKSKILLARDLLKRLDDLDENDE